jgi:hypothetical protein
MHQSLHLHLLRHIDRCNQHRFGILIASNRWGHRFRRTNSIGDFHQQGVRRPEPMELAESSLATQRYHMDPTVNI